MVTKLVLPPQSNCFTYCSSTIIVWLLFYFTYFSELTTCDLISDKCKKNAYNGYFTYHVQVQSVHRFQWSGKTLLEAAIWLFVLQFPDPKQIRNLWLIRTRYLQTFSQKRSRLGQTDTHIKEYMYTDFESHPIDFLESLWETGVVVRNWSQFFWLHLAFCQRTDSQARFCWKVLVLNRNYLDINLLNKIVSNKQLAYWFDLTIMKKKLINKVLDPSHKINQVSSLTSWFWILNNFPLQQTVFNISL